MKEEKSLYFYLYIGIVLIAICVLVFIKIFASKPKLYNLINKNNIFFTRKVKTDDYSFLDIYGIEGTIYKYKDEIYLNGFKGYIYYIRNNKHINIYQVRIDTTKNEKDSPVLRQIELSMEGFESGVVNNFNNKMTLSEEFINNNNISYKFDIPIEEKIYLDNVVYTRIFESEDGIFSINYYMDDEYLICELIKNI